VEIDAGAETRAKLEEARSLMDRALQLLDEAEAPAQIGAYLDMAICGLRAALGEELGLDEEQDEPPSPQDGSPWP